MRRLLALLGGAVAAVLLLAAVTVVAVISPLGEAGEELACASARAIQQVPTELMPVYQSAAAETDNRRQRPLGARGVWVLAAINQVETGFGANQGPSKAGAVGWMQFMPATWRQVGVDTNGDKTPDEPYGRDADGDGRADPADPEDAIHAAGAYLRAAGAPAAWETAVYAYNHAHWYVEKVLRLADAYQALCSGGGGANLVNTDFRDTRGSWAGSKKYAKALAALGEAHGCEPVSEKRPTVLTKTGNVSDHFAGNLIAYAVDIAGCDLAFPGGPLDQTARDIAAALDLPDHTGVHSVRRGKYRFELLWQTWVGGNHYNHVHIGVKRRW